MKKKAKYILLIVLFMFVAILLTELLLGIVYNYRDRDLELMAARDYPYLYFLYEQSPGRNEHGFKTEYLKQKPLGKFRIILTGGSVAMGRQQNETIAHYLETGLNKRFITDRIEVINAGVSAFVIEQVFLNVQLILQYYEPDMIVSLDGYNDIMSFKLNRQYPSGFELPPHNWRDFRVIEYNSEKKAFLSHFKNISRAIDYYKRKEFEKNYNWTALANNQLKPVSDKYWQIISDTYDFCKAKRISYYSFLQPVKYYDKNAAQTNAELKALSRLYRQIEDGTRDKPYAYSLTSIFNGRPDIFTDDCHVTPEGNQNIAKSIVERIAEDVEARIEN